MDIFGNEANPIETPKNEIEGLGLSVKGPDGYGNVFRVDDKLSKVSKTKIATTVKHENDCNRTESNHSSCVVKREDDTTRSDEYGDIFGVEDKPTEVIMKQQSNGKEVKLKKGDCEKESSSHELNSGIGLVEPGESSENRNKTDIGVTDGLKKRSRLNDRVVKGTPTVDPFMFKAMNVSEPESDDEKNYPAIYDNELNSLDDKPWREADADITDWFNYGFDEDSWRAYCAAQVKMRLSLSKKKDGGDKDKAKRTMKPCKVSPKAEVRKSRISPNKQEGQPNIPSTWKRISERGICFDFQYKGYCSRMNCKWQHTRAQSNVRQPPAMPNKTTIPRQPTVGAGMSVTPGIIPPPPPVNQGTGSADVQNFMEQLRPVSSLMHPGIIGRVHGTRDKKRKRSRRSRSRSRTRR